MVLSNSLVAKNCTFFANFIVVYTVRDGPTEWCEGSNFADV